MYTVSKYTQNPNGRTSKSSVDVLERLPCVGKRAEPLRYPRGTAFRPTVITLMEIV